MINEIKRLIKGEKKIFYDLCKSNNLNLNYEDNKTEFVILQDIFKNREYSDYFPFYKKVTILDVGAHYGYFSIFAKHNSGEGSKIIAIEPNKGNFKQFKKNILDCKLDNISCYNYAIGEKSGVSKLFHGQNPNHSIVDSYLLANKKRDFEEVEVKTLEELVLETDLKRIDFMKMDCEGAEYSIFNSTPDYIFDRITTISMEFHDLKDKNFTVENIIGRLMENKFRIVKFHYEPTSMNLNYGKLIGTKIFNQ
jgi:FkbM family methyltransferase